MAKYKLTDSGVKDTETGACIPNASGNRHWREYQKWVAEGNTPDPIYTDDEIKANQLAEQQANINNAFVDDISHMVKCEVNGVTYEMDATNDSASRLKSGIDLAVLLGESTIDIVDYHNMIHYSVPLEDALEICKKQGLAFRNNYYKRAVLREAILKMLQ